MLKLFLTYSCILWCCFDSKILANELTSSCERTYSSSISVSILCSNLTSFSTLNVVIPVEDKEKACTVKIINSNIQKISPNALLQDISSLNLVLEEVGLEEIESKAFQNYDGLKYLSLRKNQISALPARVFGKNLEELHLGENRISSIHPEAFFGMKSLKYLYLDKNIITDLGENLFQNCQNLLVFDGSGNELHVINSKSFHGAESLQTLDLSDNPLSEISINLPKLEKLSFENTGLSVVPDDFSKFTEISYLNIAHNKIEHLDPNWFMNANKLSILDVSHNDISHIDDFPKLESLSQLTLAYNHLTALPTNLSSIFPNIRILDVSGNLKIKIDANTFVNLQQLERAKFSNTNTKKIEKDMLKCNERLEELDLSHNEISFVAKNSFVDCEVRILHLNHNKLTTLTDQVFGSKLYGLNVSHNNIENIEPDTFKNSPLISLDLSNNRLTSLPDTLFENKPDLFDLHISHNQITNLPSHIFKREEKDFATFIIDASFNKLENIPNSIFGRPADKQAINFQFQFNNNPIAKDKIKAFVDYFVQSNEGSVSMDFTLDKESCESIANNATFITTRTEKNDVCIVQAAKWFKRH